MSERPDQAFDRIYGDRARRVLLTPDRTDEEQLAVQLLKSAREVEGVPTFRDYLYEKAYFFGMLNVATHEVAIAAMQDLQKLRPAGARDYAERELDALEKLSHGIGADFKNCASRYLKKSNEMADEIARGGRMEDLEDADSVIMRAIAAAKVLGPEAHCLTLQRHKELIDRLKVRRTIEQKKYAMIKADNPNASDDVVELIRLLLVELGDPVEAQLYASRLPPGVMARVLRLAQLQPDEVSEADCLFLGSWYKTQAETALVGRKFDRDLATTYLKRVQALRKQKDIQWLHAQSLLEEIALAGEKEKAEAQLAAARETARLDPTRKMPIPKAPKPKGGSTPPAVPGTPELPKPPGATPAAVPAPGQAY